MANTITGYAKILYKNYLLGLSVSSITASTGTISYIYDNDRDTSWSSIASTDSISETIEIIFSELQSINRIMAIVMNWKQFNIQYWNGSAYTDFTNVYSLKSDTATSGITYTTNTEATRYWEFDTVSTLKIKFIITKTFAVNDQKTCQEIYIGKEIGTFTDDPTCKPNSIDGYYELGDKTIELSNMGVYQVLSGRKMRLKWALKEINETSDLLIISTIQSLLECAVLLCGADGTQYTHEGWRLQDLYNCIVKIDYSIKHSIGRVAAIGHDYKFETWEV